jgi:HemK-related putative methylase
MEIYEPREDSFMLLSILENYLEKITTPLSICEIGIGSGYISQNLVKKFPQHSYFATDINKKAVNTVKELGINIDVKEGNLFTPFKEKTFDLIFFNTPYLPCEDGENYEELTDFDKAIYGGKQGYEIILQFLSQLYTHLSVDGKCFFLFSNLSNEKVIKEHLEKEEFKIISIEREFHFFEELIVYEISFSTLLKELKKLNIKHVHYLTSGKHSKIFDGVYNHNPIIIKYGNEQFITKEYFFLNKLQSTSYVPKIYCNTKECIVMEKINGETIEEFLHQATKKEIITVFQNILDICYDLDQKGIQKFEMTNPYKHIFISEKLKVTFIDFERSIFSKQPKNTTQFLQYIRRNIPLLQEKNIVIEKNSIEKIAKRYKENKKRVQIELIFDKKI